MENKQKESTEQAQTTQGSNVNVLKALLKFQAGEMTLAKTTEGYGYKYAPLDEIIEKVKPRLQELGLIYTQPLEGAKLITRLYHADSGEYLESSVDLDKLEGSGKMNNVQALGASITYLRRYSLVSLLGLVTEEDTDGVTKKDSYKPTNQAINQGEVKPASQVDSNLIEYKGDKYKFMNGIKNGKPWQGYKNVRTNDMVWSSNPMFYDIENAGMARFADNSELVEEVI